MEGANGNAPCILRINFLRDAMKKFCGGVSCECDGTEPPKLIVVDEMGGT